MSPWHWRALAVLIALGLVASALAAFRLHRRPRIETQFLAAAVMGGIPAVWIFTVAWVLPGGGHVVGVAFGCGVGGILGTVGAWVVREHDGRLRPGLAFAGTLVGATLGSAVGAAIVFVVYASGGQLPGVLMLALAAGYVGSFATLGFQVGAG